MAKLNIVEEEKQIEIAFTKLRADWIPEVIAGEG
jgi:hypothetical protein